MNIKVYYNKKVHKLPQENTKSLEKVIDSLKKIYKDKLPSNFQIFIELQDKQKYVVENDEDYQTAIQLFQQDQKGSFKLFIEKNSLQSNEDLSQSRVYDFYQQSIIKEKNNSQNELIEQDVNIQQEENELYNKIQNQDQDEEQQSLKPIDMQKLNTQNTVQDENQKDNNQNEQQQIQEEQQSLKPFDLQKLNTLNTILDENLKVNNQNDQQQKQEEYYEQEDQKEEEYYEQEEQKEELKNYNQQQNNGFQYKGSIFEDSELFQNENQEIQNQIQQQQQEVKQEKEINLQPQKPQQRQDEIKLSDEERDKLYVNQLYECYTCNGNQICDTCNSKGFLTEDDKIVKFISQIIDFKLKQFSEEFGLQRQNIRPNQPQQQQQKQQQNNENKNNKNGNGIKNALEKFQKNFVDNFKNMISSDNDKEKENIRQQAQEENNTIQKRVQQKYKAKFNENPQPVVKAKEGEKYQWNVVLANSGEQYWPKNVKFYCVQGPYVGYSENVVDIAPRESFQIDLSLQAPKLQDNVKNHLILWRLGYGEQTENNEKEIKYFGPKVAYELNVEEQNIEQKKENQDNNIQCQEADPEILSQNKQILEKAQGLQTVFGGEIKQYVTYIDKYKLKDNTLEELVELYLQKKN